MNQDEFWAIIQRSLDQGAADRRVQTETLTTELRALTAAQLESFGQVHEQQRQQAYTWDLWGAVYIIGGGCSDDEFWWFLGWLITRGRQWFERVSTKPDDLADYPDKLPDPGWELEDFSSLASEIHLEKFGYVPEMMAYESFGHPSGESWEENEEAFRSRWPRVFQKYWKR